MWFIQTVESCESTQDAVKQALTQSDNLPCIRAALQKSGRGRHGRIWQMAEGDLAFSFAVEPSRPLMEWGSLSLVAGIALAQAALKAGLDVSHFYLKWPNDMMNDQGKCAGILCEIEGAYAVIGMGVNLVPKSGCGHVAATRDAEGFMRLILDAFDGLYKIWQQGGFAALRDVWLSFAMAHGQDISVKQGQQMLRGQFAGIDDSGALIMVENGARRVINSGELLT